MLVEIVILAGARDADHRSQPLLDRVRHFVVARQAKAGFHLLRAQPLERDCTKIVQNRRLSLSTVPQCVDRRRGSAILASPPEPPLWASTIPRFDNLLNNLDSYKSA